VDHSLVDVDALRVLWSSGEPNARSFTLLQSIWLARRPETPLARDALQQTLSRSAQ
jgi:hypothetical protein